MSLLKFDESLGGDFSWDRVDSSVVQGALAIRYIDDFIDDVLWPRISHHVSSLGGKDTFREKFSRFLDDALVCAKSLDPQMPDAIIALPLVELDLELNPSEETLKEKVGAYVDGKSLDVFYLLHRIHENLGSKSPFEDMEKNLRRTFSLKDIGREFPSWQTDVDFNIFNYMVKNRIDPAPFIDFISEVQFYLLKHLPPAFTKTSEYAVCGAMIHYCAEVRSTIYDLEHP